MKIVVVVHNCKEECTEKEKNLQTARIADGKQQSKEPERERERVWKDEEEDETRKLTIDDEDMRITTNFKDDDAKSKKRKSATCLVNLSSNNHISCSAAFLSSLNPFFLSFTSACPCVNQILPFRFLDMMQRTTSI